MIMNKMNGLILALLVLVSAGGFAGCKHVEATSNESSFYVDNYTSEEADADNYNWKLDHAPERIRTGLTPQQMKIENDRRSRAADIQREENLRILRMTRNQGYKTTEQMDGTIRNTDRGNNVTGVETDGNQAFVFRDFTFSDSEN